MERLTERLGNRVINVKYASQHETAIHRLVTIEDILGDDYDLDRLRELAEADREGRCVVLPCKKGDTVWRIVNDATPHITKDRCTDIKIKDGYVWVYLIGDRVMASWNFGELLFLSREEAEAALDEIVGGAE